MLVNAVRILLLLLFWSSSRGLLLRDLSFKTVAGGGVGLLLEELLCLLVRSKLPKWKEQGEWNRININCESFDTTILQLVKHFPEKKIRKFEPFSLKPNQINYTAVLNFWLLSRTFKSFEKAKVVLQGKVEVKRVLNLLQVCTAAFFFLNAPNTVAKNKIFP